jgi:alpha-2-macroglobulin
MSCTVVSGGAHAKLAEAAQAGSYCPPLPPTIVSVKPERGEEQMISAPVIVTFDQPMDPPSTSAAFNIEPKVPGEVRVAGNALTFTPTQRLARGKEYRITVASSAAAASGLRLLGDANFRFVTAGYLEVTSTQPADKTKGVTVDTPIVVAFNRPVVPLTGTSGQEALPQPLIITPTIAGRGEWINTSIYQLTPRDGLAASTTYTVTVGSGLTDTTGGMLAEAKTFTFRTSDPTVLRWLPENNSQVRISAPISVTFSMPMDEASTEAAFTLTDETGFKVPGTFNWNAGATELGFKPTQILKFGSRYRASVGVGAKASNGQGTLRDLPGREYVMQTVQLPKITSTDPLNGNQKVSPDAGIRFGFASPMNPASLISGTITILPKPTQVYTWYNEYENQLYLDFPKLPATDYSVTLSGKLADPYGNTLGKDFVLKFRTGDLQPILQLNNQGQIGTYSAYTDTQAVILYRNLSQIQLDLYEVPVEDFVRLTGKDYWRFWENYRPAEEARLRQWTVNGKAARNTTGVIREPLVDDEGDQLKPGLYYLQVGGALTQDQRPPRQLIIRTDLNVTLKGSTDDALAWVTDLRTGLPVSGATVRFTDNEKINVSATTDADGIATVRLNTERKSWEQLVALATVPSGSLGVAATGWQDGVNAWDFGLAGGANAEPYVGYVYTDRPIYRPDQTIYWKAIIRRDSDVSYTVPAPGQLVTVTINDDMGNTLTTQTLTLNPLGAVDGSLELGPDAGLGYYYVSVRLNEQVGFGTGFQVAEYRKPEYELSAQTDKEEYSQGEPIKVTAQASYFFGGPVKNAKVRWVLLANDASFQYTGEGYWSFQDWDWWDSSRPGQFGGQISQGEARTDDQGRISITVPADISRYKTSQRFTFDITVQDANNQAVSTQATTVVHLGEFYIGVSPRGYVGQVGQQSQVDIITVDSKSRPVPNVTVQVMVSQIEWQSVREKAEDGRFYWVTRPKKTGILTETLTTDASGAAALSWMPKLPGEYKIDVTARDRRGHSLRSGAYTWVSGEDFVAWRQENNDRIKLVADKDEYDVGETAEILIPSPYQGGVKALITLERGRVITHEVMDLAGNSEVLELPIDARYAPNVYVSVTIMKGIDKTSPAPSFKMGLVQLKVSVAEKQLQVIVTPRAGGTGSGEATRNAPLVVAPRATVAWDVQTLDATGKPVSADVSLALVDKAVLTLANDQSGKLLDRFYAQRGLGVQTGVTLVYNIDRLVAQLAEDGKGGGGGGDGQGGPNSVRTEFPDIAFWRASLQTDATGRGSVEVTLPDNLTTWVMDARAATETTLVGQSMTEIISTKELLVRPVLPRFLVMGDRAEIGAIIHNTTNRDLEVAINASALGLQLSGRSSETVSIAAGSTYKAVWPATTDQSGDTVTVRVTANASAARLSDAVEITLPLLRYTTPQVMGTAGQVDADSDALELVRLPADADPTRGELVVNVEPSLAAGMIGGLQYLEHYPYECVEQTMSRFLPNVVTYQALKDLGISRPDLEQSLPQQVAVGLQRIYARQHVDGGWGWWEKDKSVVPVSTYVVFGLARAKQAGFTVDDAVLQRGIDFPATQPASTEEP